MVGKNEVVGGRGEQERLEVWQVWSFQTEGSLRSRRRTDRARGWNYAWET